MIDLGAKPNPHHGPVYAASFYPALAMICRRHGYALAVHGSLARDLDLVAIPWVDAAGEPESVIAEIMEDHALTMGPNAAAEHPHGRRVWTLICGWGECAIDLGFMPRLTRKEEGDA